MASEGKSRFRKINDWLHLWLGLISGIVVFIVCITGCIWVFNEEISAILKPSLQVDKQEKPIITPSQITDIARQAYPTQRVDYADYRQGSAVKVGVGDWEADERYTLHLDPYTGKVLGTDVHAKGETDFFAFILNGHRFLWLPWQIGRPIVNYSTMVFVVLLITGMIWWYPKKWNKSTRRKSFSIKWNGSFKRVNLDLHNVLGFYSMLFLLAIALTGMVWGIEWYSQGLYWVTSGGETLAEWQEPLSDSTQANKYYTSQQAMDLAWDRTTNDYPTAGGFYYSFPDTTDTKSAIAIYIYPSNIQFFNSVTYKFDRHTLKKLPEHEVYDASFEQASFGTKLRKLNYDIHIGSVLGFPGKVLAFLAALIGASLPITGFLVWWGKKFKDKGSSKQNREQSSVKLLVTNKKQIKPKIKSINQPKQVTHEV